MGITWTLPNIGLKKKLDWIHDGMGAGIVGCGLFTSPTSISDTLDQAAITPATFPGYVAQGISQSTVSGTNLTGTCTLVGQNVTFTCTGGGSPQTIQGAYCTMQASSAGELLVVALLPNGPQVVSQNGDSIIVQLTLTDQRAPGQP